MAKELIPHEFRTMVNKMTTPEEVKAGWALLKTQWNKIQRSETIRASINFEEGQVVSFDSRKRGRVVVGVIKRFNSKTVSLDDCRYEDGTPLGKWKVAPEYLRPYRNGLPELKKPIFGSKSEQIRMGV
jgi:hypothetical protein